ncbi:Palmitoyltransferase zdhhc3 [Cichlidogyrus casuarinus]|uniref:Palmitoyltransferase n=1 Tax=Cichlidogyrus casuarinus TaxID=1844966 RepID=A0ABD2QE74_9PLAT
MDPGMVVPMYEAPARYRGGKEDSTDWDTDARNHVDTMPRPSGDICDCLALCRRPLKLRRPPNFRQLARYSENSRRSLPFGVVWLVRDVCGLICASFTWLLILYAEFVVTCVIVQQAPSPAFSWIAGIIFQIFAINAIWSHWKAVTTDPGTVPLGNATRDAAMQLQVASGSPYPIKVVRCPKCYCVKPDRTHHCRICNRCIRKMDHHCPWVNNCVGEGNQKYFVLFTMYICLMSVWAIYMSAHFIIMCIGSDWEVAPTRKLVLPPRTLILSHPKILVICGSVCAAENGFSSVSTTLLVIFLLIEGVMFGLFTAIMFSEQMQSIYNDETVSCRVSSFLSPHQHAFSLATNTTPTPSLASGWLDFSPSSTGLLCLGLVCEAVLFGLFTLIMCTSQFCGLCHDETTIESLQKGSKIRVQRSATEAIGSVMGGPFSWRWFSPFVPPLPLSLVIPSPDASEDRMTDVVITSNNQSEMAPLRSNDELNDAQYRRFDVPGNMV